MQVWVVTGNDYPVAVYDNEAAAREFCTRKKQRCDPNRTIYWRFYEFTVNAPQPI